MPPNGPPPLPRSSLRLLSLQGLQSQSLRSLQLLKSLLLLASLSLVNPQKAVAGAASPNDTAGRRRAVSPVTHTIVPTRMLTVVVSAMFLSVIPALTSPVLMVAILALSVRVTVHLAVIAAATPASALALALALLLLKALPSTRLPEASATVATAATVAAKVVMASKVAKAVTVAKAATVVRVAAKVALTVKAVTVANRVATAAKVATVAKVANAVTVAVVPVMVVTAALVLMAVTAVLVLIAVRAATVRAATVRVVPLASLTGTATVTQPVPASPTELRLTSSRAPTRVSKVAAVPKAVVVLKAAAPMVVEVASKEITTPVSRNRDVVYRIK